VATEAVSGNHKDRTVSDRYSPGKGTPAPGLDVGPAEPVTPWIRAWVSFSRLREDPPFLVDPGGGSLVVADCVSRPRRRGRRGRLPATAREDIRARDGGMSGS